MPRRVPSGWGLIPGGVRHDLICSNPLQVSAPLDDDQAPLTIHWEPFLQQGWSYIWYHLLAVGFRLSPPLPKDGMDQSKWALPRNRMVQASKEMQTLVRPRIKLHGVWVHGVSLTLYAVHPGVPADSALVCECFMRSLQHASELFKEHHRSLPREVLIWAPQFHLARGHWIV